MEQSVLYEKRGAAALIALNRPDKRNSFNNSLLTMLYDSIEKASGDPSVRVLIITGNGPSFSSGIDLKALAAGEEIFHPRGDNKELPDIISECQKPIIGAINGHAITGGFELALNCDFLIASDSAAFADTHAKVGIHPGWGMTQLLQEAVGVRMAKQMSLSCEFIDAPTALRAGLVNEVVPEDRLIARALEIAEAITKTNEGMMMTVKNLIEFRKTTTFSNSFKHERSEFQNFVAKHMNKK